MNGFFKQARFIRQKCYIKKDKDNKITIACAGMPKSCYDNVTWENFKTGFKCKRKFKG